MKDWVTLVREGYELGMNAREACEYAERELDSIELAAAVPEHELDGSELVALDTEGFELAARPSGAPNRCPDCGGALGYRVRGGAMPEAMCPRGHRFVEHDAHLMAVDA